MQDLPLNDAVLLALSDFKAEYPMIAANLDDEIDIEAFTADYPSLMELSDVSEFLVPATEDRWKALHDLFDKDCIWAVFGDEEEGYEFFNNANPNTAIAFFVTETAPTGDIIVDVFSTDEDEDGYDDEDEIVPAFDDSDYD